MDVLSQPSPSQMPEASIDPALLPQISQTEPPRQKRKYVRKQPLLAAQREKRKRNASGVAEGDEVAFKPTRKKRQKTQARSLIVVLRYRKEGSLETHWIKTPGFVDLQLGTPPTELTVPRSLLTPVAFFQDALKSAPQPKSDAPHTTIALPDITPAAAWLYIQYRYSDSIVRAHDWRRSAKPWGLHPHGEALGKADWIETLLSAHALGVKAADVDFRDMVFDELATAIKQTGTLEPRWIRAFYERTPAGCAARRWFVDATIMEHEPEELARGLEESHFGDGFWFDMAVTLLRREAVDGRWNGDSMCVYHEHGGGRECYLVKRRRGEETTRRREEVAALSEGVDEVAETRRRDTVVETERGKNGVRQEVNGNGDAYGRDLDHDNLVD